jgi:DNA-binding protein H-NS
MPTLAELLEEKAKVEASIAALKPNAILSIKEQMAAAGVTIKDLDTRVRKSRPIKYRDGLGNTWSGVGKRPKWVNEAIVAGKTLESLQ